MSFRELRSFVETMRLLGYPNLISMESFRKPNVELVADCLYWLIKRYEPSAEIVYEIEREGDRIYFFKQVCEVALAKGRVKLNIRKLYQSDGNAVQEMLILANILKKAMNVTEADDPDYTSLQQMVAQKGVQDAKRIQQLCSDLTGDGSALFFLIDEEISQRVERQRVLSRATEVGEFERRLRDVLSNVSRQVEQLQTTIANLGADETTLEQKIESKKTQLDRAQKRLRSLLAVRPAFMEEYEKHEEDLQSQFVLYLELYRNLEYLEHELAKFNAAEDALLEEHETKLRVMRERLRNEELNALRGEANRRRANVRPQEKRGVGLTRSFGRNDHDDDDDDDDDDEDDDNGPIIIRGTHARGRVRNAAEEGSSVSDSDGSSRVANQPRPQAAFGRPHASLGSSSTYGARTNGAAAGGGGPVSRRDDGSGGGGAHESLDMTEIGEVRRAYMAGASGMAGYAGRLAQDLEPRGCGSDSSSLDDESISDSGSDINTSDITTDSDDSDNTSSI